MYIYNNSEPKIRGTQAATPSPQLNTRKQAMIELLGISNAYSCVIILVAVVATLRIHSKNSPSGFLASPPSTIPAHHELSSAHTYTLTSPEEIVLLSLRLETLDQRIIGLRSALSQSWSNLRKAHAELQRSHNICISNPFPDLAKRHESGERMALATYAATAEQCYALYTAWSRLCEVREGVREKMQELRDVNGEERVGSDGSDG
jgi:hypothetical protein